MNTSNRLSQREQGFSLVELMVAMALGLLLTGAMIAVYLNSKTSVKRQDQLSAIQQSVRTAFEYLSFDTRMVGHIGCFTGKTGLTALPTPNITNNFAVGVEGYDYKNPTAGQFTLPEGDAPNNTTAPGEWSANTGMSLTTPTIPIATLGNSAVPGLTPGSDVLVVRNIVGEPIRLDGDFSGGSAIKIISDSSTGTCPDGSTSDVSGFCPGSYGVIASCTAAQAFRVANVGPTLTLSSPAMAGTVVYTANSTEVFPVQTVAYYIKKSRNGTSTSLYRRVFDGARPDAADPDTGEEQELIENVDNMQVRYGVDTDADPDGIINGDYLTADAVADWARVVAVRISLTVRSSVPVEGDLRAELPSFGRSNGIVINYPTANRFDRRVFTTTVALRNRISYVVAP